ncbi:MAG: hypothetical protein ABFD18_06470 [Syntrophomonas sp.]
MDFLLRHIQKTIDIADGWIVGTLVIEEDKTAYLQRENGSLVPATGIIEVRNGDCWQRLLPDDFLQTTVEGWPAYAGLDARMKEHSERRCP